MSVFFRVFSKVFAFFCAISVFFILFIVLISFLSNYQKDKAFINTLGDPNSSNKIAILRLNGPILNEPSPYSDIGLLNYINIIYIDQISKIQTIEFPCYC